MKYRRMAKPRDVFTLANNYRKAGMPDLADTIIEYYKVYEFEDLDYLIFNKDNYNKRMIYKLNDEEIEVSETTYYSVGNKYTGKEQNKKIQYTLCLVDHHNWESNGWSNPVKELCNLEVEYENI